MEFWLPFSTILSKFDQKSYPPFGGFSATRGHKQCWLYSRGIIPQLGKTNCIKMPFRSATSTAHTAKRYGLFKTAY